MSSHEALVSLPRRRRADDNPRILFPSESEEALVDKNYMIQEEIR